MNTKKTALNLSNKIIASGAFNAFFAVAAGAFAAHGLKDQLTPEFLTTFKTAADYQMIHALGLILVGILQQHRPNKQLIYTAIIMFTGIALFSGSLYFLALTGIKSFGMITPLGGLCFLIAWLMLGLRCLKTGTI